MNYLMILIWQIGLSTGMWFQPPSPSNPDNNFPFDLGTVVESSTITNQSIVTNVISTNSPITTNIVTNITFSQSTTSYVVITRWSLTNMAQPDLSTFTTNDEATATGACAIAWENQWQTNKSSSLKTIENMYVVFLTNDWTTVLRQYGIVSNDYTITVTNTDENTNIGYLMTLRAVDSSTNKVTYNFVASEFTRYKDMILQLGGVMAKVQKHE